MPESQGTGIHILHLEDNSADTDLLRSHLNAAGVECSIHRVETRTDFQKALEGEAIDIIIADYTLPSYDGPSALEAARERCPEVPFVFFSGTIGEEAAVTTLKLGAVDYVLKGRPQRLAAAVLRAVRESRDRRDHQRVEAELQKRNELFQLITENVDDLIAVLDLDGFRVFSSPSYRPLLGNPQALVGTDAFAEVHPEDREAIRALFRETVATGVGRRAEYRFLLADGAVRYIESQGSVIRDSDGNVTNVVVVSRDVTERRETEDRIRAQAALLDKATDAIFVRDLLQRITYWNKGAEAVYGWNAAEILGRRADELLYREPPPNRQDIWKTVLSKGEWSGELRQVTRDGREIIVESRRRLLRDADGQPSAVFNINTDVTDRRQIESQLLRAQRMENIGALAGGIAHDLNNVLAPILMVGDVLRDELASEDSRKMLDIARDSAQRGSELVKQILSFARGAAGRNAVLQIRHLIKEMVQLARNTFPRSIQIQAHLSSTIEPVIGNATQLQQVLLNLFVNARDAMPHGGTLTVEADNVHLKRKQTWMRPDPVSGPHVLVRVADTGTGIPHDVIGSIFDPFFTTKEHGKGTGLGLPTVLNIINGHGGFIEVRSTPGRGTTFDVYLVPTEGTDKPAEDHQAAAPPAGNGECILLVDDELAILEIARETLQSYNYRVLTAADGAEALETYRNEQDRINLVISDLLMPKMDGGVLIAELQRINPSVKVIAVSGLGSQARLGNLQSLPVQAFLTKPYSAGNLLKTIHAALTGSSADAQNPHH